MRYIIPILVAAVALPAALPALAQDTEYLPLNGAVQLEKTTIPMHVPADNQFP